MKASLLEYVVCPVCGSSLELQAVRADGAEIVAGCLRCGGCGASYPIDRGVPNFVRTSGWTPAQLQTHESFSQKWRTVPGYRNSTEAFYNTWYLDRYGFGSFDSLEDFLATSRYILDAGTGTGRDSKMFAEHSRATVFGIDLGDGIFVAYDDLKAVPNLHLIQADLTCLPFRREVFDVVSCDQVIHHTPDTRASFNYLLEFVKPGGHFLTYVYKKKGPVREFCDDLIRAEFARLSFDDCMRVSRAITAFGRSLAELEVEIDVPEDIDVLGIKAGRYDLQRFLYWNVFKCYWNDQVDDDANVITNFDWYHPALAHRHAPEEVRRWCKEAGIRVEHFGVVESGTSVRVRK
jgi:SAM-dependent methyltransferase/uncharacterized protein YbaR (Trm112 family)